MTTGPKQTRLPTHIHPHAILKGLAGLGTLVILWWLLTDVLASNQTMAQRFGPGPAWAALADLLVGQEIWHHAAVSLQRVLIGLGMAAAIGIPLGLVLGWWQAVNDALSPTFQFLRMISPLSWMPIAVMVFGIGDQPVYFLLAFAAVWPIMLNTLAGVKAVDPRWLALGQSLSASRLESWRHIVLPAITGHVLTGLRLAIGVVWIVLVPCEMLGVSAGLGYFILDTRDRLDYPALMATILMIGALGFLLDWTLRTLCQTRKLAS